MKGTTTGGKLRATLRQHMLVRMSVLVSLFALALGTCELLEIHIPLAPIAVISLLMAGITAAVSLQLRRSQRVGEAQIFGQILLDVAALTALLFFTRGVYNPFAYCYLLLVLYGASALPQRFGWTLAAVSKNRTAMFRYARPKRKMDTRINIPAIFDRCLLPVDFFII